MPRLISTPLRSRFTPLLLAGLFAVSASSAFAQNPPPATDSVPKAQRGMRQDAREAGPDSAREGAMTPERMQQHLARRTADLKANPRNYSDALANNIFALPINVINDAVIEDNETIILTMPTNGAGSNFVNANVTPAILTLAPLTAHDAATVTIADPAPVGITLGAWTCTASGTSCPAATGSGAIAQTVNLPVGASLVYQLQAAMSASTQCLQSVTNTASINTTALSPGGAELTEGSSVQGNAGYVFQSNTASVSHLVAACADVSISKSNGLSTLTAGQATTYTVIVGNAGPANANNSLFKDPAAAGLSCTSVASRAAQARPLAAALGL